MGALETKAVKRTKLFSEVNPKNPSVKKWIMSIWDGYPECMDEAVDDLLNVFRDSLFTRSKERNRIVGLLMAPDRLLLIHCRKDASLAEMDDQVITADIVLHSRNLLRAAMISRGQDGLTFSAFEQNRRLSKGFADFWQIDPDEIAWESIGSIILNIELETFRWPIQVPIEPEQLDELIHDGDVSTLGHIRIGNQPGTITMVEVLGKQMTFSQFMDFYVTEKEQLEDFRARYRKLVSPNSIESFDPDLKKHYDYEEDAEWIYKIEATGTTRFLKKEHPKFTVCFFTSQPPGIHARNSLSTLISKSIFETSSLSIWHPELETSN